MEDVHFTIDEKTRAVSFTDEGNDFLEELLQSEGILPDGQSLYDPESTTIVHHVNQGCEHINYLLKIKIILSALTK